MKTQPVALVTGATSGIGEAAAHRLHARGYAVYAVGRNPDALAALGARGLQARELDVTDEAALQRLAEEIAGDHGGVDVLVNCAGFPLTGPLEQVPLAELRRLFETNVVAALALTQAVLPAMRARGAGRIITIGSTGGRFTSPGAGGYHVVKYGLEAFSLTLHAEVAQFGVRAVLIDPTGVRTPFVADQLEAKAQCTYADDDPYGAFKRRYDESTRSLTETPGMMVSADRVARAIVRAAEAKNPRPCYVVGASGKATLLARALLTDRMWNRILIRGLRT